MDHVTNNIITDKMKIEKPALFGYLGARTLTRSHISIDTVIFYEATMGNHQN